KRDTDGISVIIKTLADDFYNEADALHLKREYEILNRLKIEGVPAVIAFEQFRSPMLILEDIGGQPLLNFMESKESIPQAPFVSRNSDSFNLNSFLNFSIVLSSILVELHREHIIHKDINPKNIVWNPQTGRLQLIDFSIASRLPRQDQNPSHP